MRAIALLLFVVLVAGCGEDLGGASRVARRDRVRPQIVDPIDIRREVEAVFPIIQGDGGGDRVRGRRARNALTGVVRVGRSNAVSKGKAGHLTRGAIAEVRHE